MDVFVDCFACFHETVAEMGVLIQCIFMACEGEDVFVVSRSELRGW